MSANGNGKAITKKNSNIPQLPSWMKGLDQNVIPCIKYLAQGMTYDQIAKQSDVHLSLPTLKGKLRFAIVKKAVAEFVSARFEKSQSMLEDATVDAVNEFKSIMSTSENDGHRLAAASKIMEYAYRTVEIREVMQKLALIESALSVDNSPQLERNEHPVLALTESAVGQTINLDTCPKCNCHYANCVCNGKANGKH